VVDDDGIDFALAAFRESGEWQLEELSRDHLGDVEAIAAALQRLPGDDGALAMVSVDEDFFVLVRVVGASTRVLLSDVTAAEEWELASSAAEHLGLPDPDEDDEPVPAGDLGLLGDLGLAAAELGELLDDEELVPEDALYEIAGELGFADLFDDVLDDSLDSTLDSTLDTSPA
jgi:putative tRNA adenosine deaminase-associated protein